MVRDPTDRIYEAATHPGLWPEVLQAVAEHVNARASALVLRPNLGVPRWVVSSGSTTCPTALTDSALRHREQPDPSRTSAPCADVIAEAACGSAAERQCDGGWQVGFSIALTRGDAAFVMIEPHASGPTCEAWERTDLDRVRPHFARACRLGLRLGHERAAATARALSLLGLPAAVLTECGQVLHVNERLAALEGVLIAPTRTRITFRNSAANKQMQAAMADMAGHPEQRHAPRSIPVRACADHGAFIVHVIPLAERVRDPLNAAAALLVAKPVRAPRTPDDCVLNVLFDLTPAEARLLRALAGGARLQAYAEDAGVRHSTVRTQLASIFSKTGTSRQAELLSVVASISVLDGHGARL